MTEIIYNNWSLSPGKNQVQKSKMEKEKGNRYNKMLKLKKVYLIRRILEKSIK